MTVKDKQPTLREAIRVLFQEPPTLAHGRIEQRAIWTAIRLHRYLNFSSVAQLFAIGTLKSGTQGSIATTIQRPASNVRLVLDYLRMTANFQCSNPQLLGQAE